MVPPSQLPVKMFYTHVHSLAEGQLEIKEKKMQKYSKRKGDAETTCLVGFN